MNNSRGQYDVEKKDGYSIINILVEKLDTNIAPALKSELVLIAGNGENNVIMNLKKCKYCDSSGLSAILIANRLCKNSNHGTFVLANLQPAVDRLITISQLNSVLNITDTVDQAVEFIKEEKTAKQNAY